MYTDEDITSAVQAGVLTDQDAASFRDHVADLRKAKAVDDEHFRLITGFNDVFVVIACLLLLSSIVLIGREVNPWCGVLVQTAWAWMLAEYFTRKRRMALPSIVLLLAFVGGVLGTGIILFKEFGFSDQFQIGISSGVAALAAWLHWIRFKVPITVAAGTASLVTAVIVLLITGIPGAEEWIIPIFFAAGVIVFILAMRWDASDTLRQTRRSDVAFWLHLVAAPLLVHPVFGELDSQPGIWQAAAVGVLYVVIALISLSIDRRALMTAALIYLLIVFESLLRQYGVVSLSFALTAFTIGTGLLFLTAFWHGSRKAILQFYPPSIQERLPRSDSLLRS